MTRTEAEHVEEPEGGFRRFQDFYPYYLAEHRNTVCRVLHFVGSSLVLCVLAAAIISGNAWYLLLMPIIGYGFAWVGHFIFEKNRPATFRYPLYSLAGDWVMFWDLLMARRGFSPD